MNNWIEQPQEFQYIVRESDFDDILDQGDGVQIFVTNADGQQKTVSISFDKAKFPSMEQAQEWLASKSRKTEDRSYTKRSAYLSKKDLLGAESGTNRPTEEQLEKINQYTRKSVDADDVAVFPTLACNDLIDRDIDAFTPKALRQMVELEGDVGISGKSLMLSHDYRTLPTGRLFDAQTARKGGMNTVRIWSYIPNTEQYKDFIENIDFGLYWAVSVGLMVESVTCSICKSGFDWWFNWQCEQGHEKGKYYDTSAPVDGKNYSTLPKSSDSGVLCYAKMENPTDFMELSVCFLGAQYSAQFEKNAGFLKAASADIRKNPDLQMAYDLSKTVSVKADEIDLVLGVKDSVPEWVGDQVALQRTLDALDTFPSDSSALELSSDTYNIVADVTYKGIEFTPEMETNLKSATQIWGNTFASSVTLPGSKDTHETAGGTSVSEKIAALVLGVKTVKEQIELSAQDLKMSALSLRTATEGNEAALELLDAFDEEVKSIETALEAVQDIVELDAEDEEAIDALVESEKIASGAQLREANKELTSANEALKAAQDQITKLNGTIAILAPMAEAGESYVETVKSEIVEFYRLVQAGPGEASEEIDVTFVETLVERCSDDVAMLEHLRKDYEKQYRARFPGAGSIRSTAEEDANVIPGLTNGANEVEEEKPEKAPNPSHSRVAALHG